MRFMHAVTAKYDIKVSLKAAVDAWLGEKFQPLTKLLLEGGFDFPKINQTTLYRALAMTGNELPTFSKTGWKKRGLQSWTTSPDVALEYINDRGLIDRDNVSAFVILKKEIPMSDQLAYLPPLCKQIGLSSGLIDSENEVIVKPQDISMNDVHSIYNFPLEDDGTPVEVPKEKWGDLIKSISECLKKRHRVVAEQTYGFIKTPREEDIMDALQEVSDEDWVLGRTSDYKSGEDVSLDDFGLKLVSVKLEKPEDLQDIHAFMPSAKKGFLAGTDPATWVEEMNDGSTRDWTHIVKQKLDGKLCPAITINGVFGDGRGRTLLQYALGEPIMVANYKTDLDIVRKY